MWRASVLGLVAACGRFGFDPLGTGITDAPGDASGDGTLPGDGPFVCPPTAILCEDFEASLVGWTTEIQGAGTVTRTSAITHRGIGALVAQVPPSGGSSRAAIFRAATGTAPVVAARVWVQAIEPLLRYDHVVTWFGTPEERFFAFGGDQLGNWVFSEGVPPGSFNDYQSTTPAPVGVWKCVEAVRTLGTPTRMQLYVDDVLLLDDPLIDASPVYDLIMIGLPRGDDGGAHVLLDDLVLSDRRIGCQ